VRLRVFVCADRVGRLGYVVARQDQPLTFRWVKVKCLARRRRPFGFAGLPLRVRP
jgi:hypothetical protein